MSDLPDIKLELREMQPLFALLAHRPVLLKEMEWRFGLQRVEANDVRTMSPEQAIGINEALHASGVPDAPPWAARLLGGRLGLVLWTLASVPGR